MDWRNYISVMTPCAASGNLVFSLTTYDAASNISLTFSVSALSTDTEVSLARQINNQITTILTQASAYWNAIPAFSNQPPNASFYLGQTDNIVSIWSQAQFLLTLDSNDSGSTIQISSNPTFVTLATAKAWGPLLGLNFSDSNEVLLTDDQIMAMLQIASNQICSLINNNLVIANFLQEYIGHMDDAVLLRVGPILSYDTPVIRPPIYAIANSYYLYLYPYSFQVDRKLKLLNYRFASNLMGDGDPFDSNYEVKMTYRAGYLNIPKIIQEKTLLITTLMLNDPNVKSLKGGSFAVEFRLPVETYKSISAELSAYKLQ